MGIWDFGLLLFIAPALILGLIAQWRVKSAFSSARNVPARMTGAAAAKYVLDSAGVTNVTIEPVQGYLSDHYDPRHKVLRLSPDVYSGRSMAAVGIAAHEAGHALQDAHGYMPLVVRNAAVPMAGFGSNAGVMLLMLGVIFNFQMLLLAGIVLFSGVVFFQVVNLPVEFNASSRAKAELVRLGIVDPGEMQWVNKVLNAAAMTYVAATLQSVLTLLYYVMRFMANSRR
jgi:uncharacterized protein